MADRHAEVRTDARSRGPGAVSAAARARGRVRDAALSADDPLVRVSGARAAQGASRCSNRSAP